ncbi:low affinity immunoglobulin epsilon Fc receptor-like isoform X5 [Xyrauchen texanus]|uniref:low affinity immunoglobulin epsilon Fc receptor-like isoform X4 n=1 Tax=Xyrauchen texanus TaxID=154827 RepID=UPI002242941F|nr:low affinity immunoglobulin epsilon Fc receptor-like isoform X4 [Xyrauchen texanus]XP_051991419.1 low affinity immunoglobulin epsilon Fc receptor-like isoform X5 [Xyrauchen texanus]
MDLICEDSSYIHLTRTASGDKSSHYKCLKPFNQDIKKEVLLPKWTKVLLIVLSVSVVCALVGVCVLGMRLSHAKHSSISVSDQSHNDTDYKGQFEELRVQYEETLGKLNRLNHSSISVSDQSHNDTDFKGQFEELRVQYEETLRKLNRLNQSTGCALCAVHWIHSGGKCYYFSTVKMNWTQSRDYCVTLGGHLVIITSKAVQDFLVSEVKETHWIGLNDLETEGHWVWVNNQPLSDSTEFWIKRENGVREPDNWTKDHPADLNIGNEEEDLTTNVSAFHHLGASTTNTRSPLVFKQERGTERSN